MYVRDDIPCKLIPMRSSIIEGFFIKLKLRKKEKMAIMLFLQSSSKIYFQPTDGFWEEPRFIID